MIAYYWLVSSYPGKVLVGPLRQDPFKLRWREQYPLRWLSLEHPSLLQSLRHCLPLNFFLTPLGVATTSPFLYLCGVAAWDLFNDRSLRSPILHFIRNAMGHYFIIVVTWAWLLENEELYCVAQLDCWYFPDFACCFFYCCLTILHLSVEYLRYYWFY